VVAGDPIAALGGHRDAAKDVAAAESVVKNGLPVPPAKITTLPSSM
jgi:hypothetical protein